MTLSLLSSNKQTERNGNMTCRHGISRSVLPCFKYPFSFSFLFLVFRSLLSRSFGPLLFSERYDRRPFTNDVSKTNPEKEYRAVLPRLQWIPAPMRIFGKQRQNDRTAFGDTIVIRGSESVSGVTSPSVRHQRATPSFAHLKASLRSSTSKNLFSSV